MPESQTNPAWKPQRLRVPREDGALLVRPGLPQAAELAESNAQRLDGASINLQGRTLEHLRRWTRTEVAKAAAEYTRKITGEDVTVDPAIGFIVGGHQPELFHPGVWVKNFAVAEVARRTGSTPLNIVIDNDLLAKAAIRVPAGTRENPGREWLPFDADHPRQPWEEATAIESQLLTSFPDRVTEAMRPWGIEPVAKDAMPRCSKSPTRLADCLTAKRVGLERAWGLHNLEVPISRVCELDPFLWFTSHILAQLPRFREIYNAALHEYRQINGVRSHTHPVPELKQDGDWLEAPFWVWHSGDRQRLRLFARQVGRTVELSDGKETFATLRLSPEMEACCAVEDLRKLPERGIRLRTRALTTTLFSRLCLADLFVHGIGGAKYDEMTDQIIRRFYGIEPPGFLTISATLHLPLGDTGNVTPADAMRLRALLRDLRYNADRHLTPGMNAEADELIAEKYRLVAEQQASRQTRLPRSRRRARSRENYERFRRLLALNEKLAAFAADQIRHVREELGAIEKQLEAQRVLHDRQYAFCLFPEEKIRSFMTGLAGHASD